MACHGHPDFVYNSDSSVQIIDTYSVAVGEVNVVGSASFEGASIGITTMTTPHAACSSQFMPQHTSSDGSFDYLYSVEVISHDATEGISIKK